MTNTQQEELQQERDQYGGLTKEEYLDVYTVDCYQCSEELDEEAVLCGSDICQDCWSENGN